MNYNIQFNRKAIYNLIQPQMEELSVDEILDLLEANPQLINIVVREETYSSGVKGGKVYNKKGKVIGFQG